MPAPVTRVACSDSRLLSRLSVPTMHDAPMKNKSVNRLVITDGDHVPSNNARLRRMRRSTRQEKFVLHQTPRTNPGGALHSERACRRRTDHTRSDRVANGFVATGLAASQVQHQSRPVRHRVCVVPSTGGMASTRK